MSLADVPVGRVRVAVVEQAIALRLVTLDDVRRSFPSRIPPALR